MGNKHLSDDTIARCAESLIMTGTVSFSKSVKEHLDYCMTCSVQVQVKIDQLKASYQERIYNNLVGTSLSFGMIGK